MSNYYPLDEKEAILYLKKTGIIPDSSTPIAEEIGDGNINMVFNVFDENKSVIIKQAYPYVRCVGESWPLSIDRIRIEADALEIQTKIAGDFVPKIYYRDNTMALFIMENLSHLSLMRLGMIKMAKYPQFTDHISTFLANLSFFTSDFHMNPIRKKELVKQFINPDLCKITEDLIFTDPFYDCERNNVNPPLRSYLEKVFWKKEYLKLESAKLKYKFLTNAQCLLHGDLHTGSIFVNENETKVFDSEFAFVGPHAFDMGLLFGNILINYVSWDGKDYSEDLVKDYRDYLFYTLEDIYKQFIEKFTKNWKAESNEIMITSEEYLHYYLEHFFSDMIGFASLVMIRRMHGLAHNIDIDEIVSPEVRKDIQIKVLELAEELLMKRNKFRNDINAVIQCVKQNIY